MTCAALMAGTLLSSSTTKCQPGPTGSLSWPRSSSSGGIFITLVEIAMLHRREHFRGFVTKPPRLGDALRFGDGAHDRLGVAGTHQEPFSGPVEAQAVEAIALGIVEMLFQAIQRRGNFRRRQADFRFDDL